MFRPPSIYYGFAVIGKKRVSVYLSVGGHRALTQTDCLLLKAERVFAASHRNESPDAFIFIVSADYRLSKRAHLEHAKQRTDSASPHWASQTCRNNDP